jgi:hypothetical protein
LEELVHDLEELGLREARHVEDVLRRRDAVDEREEE